MDKILKKAADVLVERGYASSYESDKRKHLQHNPPITMIGYDQDGDAYRFECNPFADTLEGRRQADAIEDWFTDATNDKWNLWHQSGIEIYYTDKTNHQWRLDRIKWCLEQLVEDNE